MELDKSIKGGNWAEARRQLGVEHSIGDLELEAIVDQQRGISCSSSSAGVPPTVPEGGGNSSSSKHARPAVSPAQTEDDSHVVWGKVEISSESCSEASSIIDRPGGNLQAAIPSNVVFKHEDSRSLSGDSANSVPKGGAARSLRPREDVPDEKERRGRWSIGSKHHDQGRCKPCAWVWKASGCVNGQRCEFCHTCELGQMKVRKKERIAVMKKKQERKQQVQGSIVSL